MTKKKFVPILCMDFDGVLHSYKTGWQGPRTIPDPPVPGALAWVVNTVRSGKMRVAVYSSRSRYLFGRWKMKEWIWYWLQWDVGLTKKEAFDILAEISFPNYKPPAMVSIDDRAIRFTGEFPPLEHLLASKPWNKKGVTIGGREVSP